jgi:hypothetical protein
MRCNSSVSQPTIRVTGAYIWPCGVSLAASCISFSLRRHCQLHTPDRCKDRQCVVALAVVLRAVRWQRLAPVVIACGGTRVRVTHQLNLPWLERDAPTKHDTSYLQDSSAGCAKSGVCNGRNMSAQGAVPLALAVTLVPRAGHTGAKCITWDMMHARPKYHEHNTPTDMSTCHKQLSNPGSLAARQMGVVNAILRAGMAELAGRHVEYKHDEDSHHTHYKHEGKLDTTERRR